MNLEIRPSVLSGDVAAVQLLWREYWTSLALDDGFQDFGREIASLPGAYAPPRGAVLVACVDGEPVGTVALRPLPRESACEAKRLYVRPEYRGQGIGRALLDHVLRFARDARYDAVYADTLPSLTEAIGMYEAMGFERSGPYSDSPTPGAIYLRRTLSACR